MGVTQSPNVTKILENIVVGAPPLSNNSKKIKEIKIKIVACYSVDETTFTRMRDYCQKKEQILFGINNNYAPVFISTQ